MPQAKHGTKVTRSFHPPDLFDSGVEARRYTLYLANAFDWLEEAEPLSMHAVVTDPPYGLLEYRPDQLEKMRNGNGGVWRIPPSFDGCKRRPLPRFTVLSDQQRRDLRDFFSRLATLLMPVLVPGGHVFVATNPLVSHLVYEPFIATGFEKRGEIIRVVHTLRGGDRPKNAHEEFHDVTVMPRPPGSLHGVGLHHRGRLCLRTQQHRPGGERGILRDGADGHSETGPLHAQ